MRRERGHRQALDHDAVELAMKAAQLRVGLLSMLLVIGSSAPADAEEADAGWEKVVFHVDETANASWSLMLARSYLDDSPKARVVVVAYGQGVDCLREDAKDKRGNPYDHRVLSLADRAVEFRVCAATLGAKAIAKEDLLDPVVIVPSGISEIARLQLKEGFASLKP
jgi:intracellular sulfur oxidation DsrE/DsrF family protein